MPALNYSEVIKNNTKDFQSMEHLLGINLLQPFNSVNSGARKIMSSVHHTHNFPLMHAEKAIIEGRYETAFGDYSSSVTRADHDYTVVAKISKFSFAPNHHYYLIIQENGTNKLDVVERISYHYITETYGYLYNNQYMDNLNIGEVIHTGDVVQKSIAFDEYNNRKDGINLNVAYLALDDNMEDSVVLSDVAAGRFTSPLIKKVEIMINDNDIPVNIYGDDNNYKIFPDIGEDIVNANLIALRQEKKEESYYTQSVNRLREILPSDERKQTHGKVIDVNIYCNNPEILNGYYYSQLKKYYDELHRMSTEIVRTLMPYAAAGYEMSYELQKLYGNAKRVNNNDPYIDKRTFSNIIIEIDVLEEKQLEAGDKLSNRYGGKGVVSQIWPQQFMPRFKDSKGNYIYTDLIFNSSTMYNRENPGQVFENSITHIGCSILDHIIDKKLDLNQAYDLIHKYVEFCSPQQATYMEEKKNNMSTEELMFFIESIINEGAIHLSMRPISDVMTIDKLDEMYKAFPFVKPNNVEVAMVSSDGKLRYTPARRTLVIGKQYIYRLKQFSEDKFSATSLSATNIRNENTKSKVKKDFRELYSATPIRFGNMETNNMAHIGVEALIANMMIHSLSPQGRRLVEQMYTGDPFHIDIKLDSESKNRSAEIANTYLKTVGRKLVFYKKPKKVKRITISPVSFDHDPFLKPISFVPENMREGFDYEKDFQDRQKLKEAKLKSGAKSPIRFEGIDKRRNKRS